MYWMVMEEKNKIQVLILEKIEYTKVNLHFIYSNVFSHTHNKYLGFNLDDHLTSKTEKKPCQTLLVGMFLNNIKLCKDLGHTTNTQLLSFQFWITLQGSGAVADKHKVRESKTELCVVSWVCV